MPPGPGRSSHSCERSHQLELVLELPQGEEPLPDASLRGLPEALPHGGIPQELHEPVPTLLRGVHQETADAVLDLQPDAAHVAADDRLLLPHGFRYDEAEAFADR